MTITKAQRAALEWLDNPVSNFKLHGRVWNNLLTAGLVTTSRGQLCLTEQGRKMLKESAPTCSHAAAHREGAMSTAAPFHTARAARRSTRRDHTSLCYCTSRCYACDATACGVRDRRPEGGMVEAACKRHADPTIKAYAACVYCSGPRPTLTIDGDFAHKGCHAEAVRS